MERVRAERRALEEAEEAENAEKKKKKRDEVRPAADKAEENVEKKKKQKRKEERLAAEQAEEERLAREAAARRKDAAEAEQAQLAAAAKEREREREAALREEELKKEAAREERQTKAADLYKAKLAEASRDRDPFRRRMFLILFADCFDFLALSIRSPCPRRLNLLSKNSPRHCEVGFQMARRDHTPHSGQIHIIYTRIKAWQPRLHPQFFQKMTRCSAWILPVRLRSSNKSDRGAPSRKFPGSFPGPCLSRALGHLGPQAYRNWNRIDANAATFLYYLPRCRDTKQN